jgi:hypothetical protein
MPIGIVARSAIRPIETGPSVQSRKTPSLANSVLAIVSAVFANLSRKIKSRPNARTRIPARIPNSSFRIFMRKADARGDSDVRTLVAPPGPDALTLPSSDAPGKPMLEEIMTFFRRIPVHSEAG